MMNEGNFINAIDSLQCIRDYYTPRLRFRTRMNMAHASVRSRIILSSNNTMLETLQSQFSHMASYDHEHDTIGKQRERWLRLEFRNSKTKKEYQKPYMCHLNK